MIIVLFGQPHSGKTTIAEEVIKDLPNTELIDGDRFRAVFKNTDYSKEGREKNIQKAFDIAKYLDKCGNDVVISLVSPYKELREEFKSQCKVQEIYCHTKKIRGREDKFALDYEPPTEFYIDLDTSENSDDTFKKLLKFIL